MTIKKMQVEQAKALYEGLLDGFLSQEGWHDNNGQWEKDDDGMLTNEEAFWVEIVSRD